MDVVVYDLSEPRVQEVPFGQGQEIGLALVGQCWPGCSCVRPLREDRTRQRPRLAVYLFMLAVGASQGGPTESNNRQMSCRMKYTMYAIASQAALAPAPRPV